MSSTIAQMEVQNEPFEHKPCHANATAIVEAFQARGCRHNAQPSQRTARTRHEFKDAQDGLNVFQCVFQILAPPKRAAR